MESDNEWTYTACKLQVSKYVDLVSNPYVVSS